MQAKSNLSRADSLHLFMSISSYGQPRTWRRSVPVPLDVRRIPIQRYFQRRRTEQKENGVFPRLTQMCNSRLNRQLTKWDIVLAKRYHLGATEVALELKNTQLTRTLRRLGATVRWLYIQLVLVNQHRALRTKVLEANATNHTASRQRKQSERGSSDPIVRHRQEEKEFAE